MTWGGSAYGSGHRLSLAKQLRCSKVTTAESSAKKPGGNQVFHCLECKFEDFAAPPKDPLENPAENLWLSLLGSSSTEVVGKRSHANKLRTRVGLPAGATKGRPGT